MVFADAPAWAEHQLIARSEIKKVGPDTPPIKFAVSDRRAGSAATCSERRTDAKLIDEVSGCNCVLKTVIDVRERLRNSKVNETKVSIQQADALRIAAARSCSGCSRVNCDCHR